MYRLSNVAWEEDYVVTCLNVIFFWANEDCHEKCQEKRPHDLMVRESVWDPLDTKPSTATFCCGFSVPVGTQTVVWRNTTRFIRPRGSARSSWFTKRAIPFFFFCIGGLLISGYGAKLLFPLCLSDRMHGICYGVYIAHACENTWELWGAAKRSQQFLVRYVTPGSRMMQK
jgi:hypothetical protein